ncbi:hypothetical protein [Bradyrhizobium sp. SZCCHNR1098]|uniref:hypothetical protein n=1 Tax=Bradyrhizobium sp. SZCCHNR1098 TaxID=3057370 RepID=UPI002916CFEB|nr:hypothetical protein [Bradyrhizobium sp. SZCCHNR1098]
MRDAERDAWTFAELLVPWIGEVLINDPEGKPLTLARIVQLACQHYGEAALPLLDAEITVH